jgi:hypothetical protein
MMDRQRPRVRKTEHADMLFNSPSEVEIKPNLSGRSSDLRFSDLGRPSQNFHSSGFGQIAKLSALTATG